MNKNKEFLELLHLNNNLEIRNWLIENGKGAKPYAGLMFEKSDDKNEKKN